MPPTNKPEHDALVQSYVHLVTLQRADEALRTLKKVASVVKPIMRSHNWKVRELAEFYPSNQSLLGLNVNRGRQICLRLRHAGDKTQFLPLDHVIDTMLHELCHNVHGPHNSSFHALWDTLRDEYTDLIMRGFTGEAFLSEGRRLGGSGVPSRRGIEARQTTLAIPSGRRLGGKAVKTKYDMRRAAADAAEKRQRELQGCGTDKLSDAQIRDLSQTATKNGFRTQAEEDEANEAAIAQALRELVDIGETTQSARKSPAASSSFSRGGSSDVTLRENAGLSNRRGEPSRLTAWVCAACTLRNKPTHLCCDACGKARMSYDGKQKKVEQAATVIDLT